jgi:hypothetical protein
MKRMPRSNGHDAACVYGWWLQVCVFREMRVCVDAILNGYSMGNDDSNVKSYFRRYLPPEKQAVNSGAVIRTVVGAASSDGAFPRRGRGHGAAHGAATLTAMCGSVIKHGLESPRAEDAGFRWKVEEADGFSVLLATNP